MSPHLMLTVFGWYCCTSVLKIIELPRLARGRDSWVPIFPGFWEHLLQQYFYCCWPSLFSVQCSCRCETGSTVHRRISTLYQKKPYHSSNNGPKTESAETSLVPNLIIIESTWCRWFLFFLSFCKISRESIATFLFAKAIVVNLSDEQITKMWKAV